MDAKEKKVFSFKNFKGLDKENKLTKVSPNRASDGKNFIIDSDTLKTRPAFKFYKEPNIYLEEDDYIIDWYEYQDVIIYVTKKHIVIEGNDFVYNETSSEHDFIHSMFNMFNFEGLTPHFQEEKNCLFIFCLNDIFVFSIIYDESKNKKYVLYDLKNKPSGIINETNGFYKEFEELPNPYEPTLFIGDKRFEDVNLLSNVSKYSLFASTETKQEGNKILYNLATHYNQNKNGNFTYDITFFKDRLKGLDILPIYAGIHGENFEYLSSYGNIINDNTPTVIQDIFFPISDHEYYIIPATETEQETYKKISGKYGLDKTTFFNMRIKDINQKVFDFIITYIKNNESTLTQNSLYCFSLPTEYNVIYRNETNNFIVKKELKRENIKIYIELRKYETTQFHANNQNNFESNKIYENNESNNYPTSPFIESDYSDIIKINNFNNNFSSIPTLNDFKKSAEFAIFSKKDVYQNGSTVLVVGNYKENKISSSNRGVSLDSSQDWEDGKYSDVTISDPSTYPFFPAFDSTGVPTSNIITHSITYSGIVFKNGFEDNKVKSDIVIAIIDKINGFSTPVGRGFAKIYIFSTDYELCRPIVVGFNYDKGSQSSYIVKKTYASTYSVSKEQILITEDLSEFTFNQENNCFELKVKDYFFDYNNEPSIDVKVKFEFNPDYEMISKTRFGTTFGSENRLFLAGHEKYPNMDRYNVSNDLLGDNVKNQSYELSYFPSKNYRVIGGNGKINGYVVATDTTLYVTKEEYRNDEKLFVRERILDEKGVVGYKEHKTNIDKSPLNNKSIVRFYNDILILSKDGLHAIEISSNVLTNERLVKLRSGFINKDLVKAIENYPKDKVFILENNHYLYIFIGNNVYVADSRYTETNKNSEIGNISYEIVKWETPLSYKTGHFIDNKLNLLTSNGKQLFNLKENESYDTKTFDMTMFLYDNAFMMSNEYEYLLENPQNVSFTFKSAYKLLAVENKDYILNGNTIEITDYSQFAVLKNGDKIYVRDFIDNTFYSYDVNIVDNKIIIPNDITAYERVIYTKIDNIPLYISLIYDYYVPREDYYKMFALSPYRNETIETITKQENETDEEYNLRLNQKMPKNLIYIFDNAIYNTEYQRIIESSVIEEKPIEMIWISCITDLGNNLMEKTMFRTNLYATKQAQGNTLSFGYKTLRGSKTFNNTNEMPLIKPFGIDDINLNLFSLTTFNEFGTSLPLKENNFLYIQFIIKGYGNIELNSIEIIYKFNRMLKTIG